MAIDTAPAPPPAPSRTTGTVRPPGALRGLVLGFLLSAVNLFGAFLTVAALGGREPWTTWQFIGLFALVEVASGLGFILGPNIWKLPVVQGETDQPVRLAASSILRPHWAAGAKTLAGVVLLTGTAYFEGAGAVTLGLGPLVLGILAAILGLSLLAARLGVIRPELDVYGFTIRRPRSEDKVLPGFSLSAAFVQMLINIGTFPAVKLLQPSALYQPALGPSLAVIAWSGLIGGILLLAGFAAWSGRLSLRARRHQRAAEALVEREPAPTGS